MDKTECSIWYGSLLFCLAQGLFFSLNTQSIPLYSCHQLSWCLAEMFQDDLGEHCSLIKKYAILSWRIPPLVKKITHTCESPGFIACFHFILLCNHNETYPGMLYQSIPINVATMSQPKTSKNSAGRRKSAAATKVCSLFRRRCSVSWPVRSREPKIIFADSLESTALLTRSDCMLDLHMSSPQASKIGQRNLTLRTPQLRPFFVARIGLFAKQGNSRTASVSRVLSAQPEIHLSFNHRWQKYLEGRALQSPNPKHNMLVCSQLLFKLLVLLSLFLDNSWYDPHDPSSFPSNIFKMQILDNIGAPSACMPVASAMGHSGQLLRNSRVSANHRSSSAISWQKLSVNHHSWSDRINPAPSVTIHLVSPAWRPAIWALQLHWANKMFHGSLVRPSTLPFTHSFRKQKLCFGFRTWGKTCVLSKSLNIDKLQGPSVSIIHSSINIHSSGCFGQAGGKLRMASGAVLFRSGQNKYGLQAGT